MASSSSDWRNVRVKEEPMSDVEDGRRSSSSHGRGDRDRSYRDLDRGRGGDDGGRRSIKRERNSPSPPPSHSRHRSSRPASRSRSRSRSRSPTNRDGDRGGRRGDRDGGSSGGGRSKGSSRWERSRSRERPGPGSSESYNRDNRERRRPSSREREHPRSSSRHDEGEIKRERGSPDRDRDLLGFKRPPPQDRRGSGRDGGGDRGGRGGGGRGGGGSGNCFKCGEAGHFARECPTGGGGGGPNRPRDGKREKDWDNFFNPKSEMSQQAFNKRDREEQDRKVATQGQEFGGGGEGEEEKPKEQPNFGLSGKLTEETNTFRGVVIKYSEPPEARKPNKIKWRFYPFKGEEALEVMYVHRQSAYLIGRDRKIADMPVDHPSCSKQHAVLQYRLVPYERADGSKGRRIKPYVIDLESANGTFVNGKQIDSKRYVELFEKDVLKFGFSSREYVLLHDESKDIQDDSPELTPD